MFFYFKCTLAVMVGLSRCHDALGLPSVCAFMVIVISFYYLPPKPTSCLLIGFGFELLD